MMIAYLKENHWKILLGRAIIISLQGNFMGPGATRINFI